MLIWQQWKEILLVLILKLALLKLILQVDYHIYLMKVMKGIFYINTKKRHNGKLKFFDERKSYGFLLMDSDNSDVFVH